jgi:hypothetical protein
VKPSNILVALCALVLLALALPRGANSNNKVNGGAEGSANLAKPRAHQFEKETREGARLAWIDESYKTSSSKPQESRKIRPVDFLVNLPRLSTMRNSGGAAGRLPAWTANAVGLWPCASEKGNNGLFNRMAAISQKCPAATTEIILAAFKYGRQYRIEPELLLAIGFVESSFRPWIVNGDCRGWLQVNYPVWKDALHLDRGRLLEVDYCADAACQILRQYIDHCKGDVWQGVFMYTNGYKGRNMTYVPKVRKFYRGIGGEK